MVKATLILAFWLGVILAGSDGGLFPWLNFLGAELAFSTGIKIIEVFQS